MVQVLFGDEAAHAEDVFPLFDARFFEIFRKIGDLPKKDGFTLAQDVRAANAEIPIIFLTAKTLKEDILEGFKIGADDYIAITF